MANLKRIEPGTTSQLDLTEETEEQAEEAEAALEVEEAEVEMTLAEAEVEVISAEREEAMVETEVILEEAGPTTRVTTRMAASRTTAWAVVVIPMEATVEDTTTSSRTITEEE